MNTIYDLEDVIRLIRDETLLNIDMYVSFLVNGTVEELKSHMHLYLCHKIYDTPYGDMVPLVLSNALGLTLLILSKTAPESIYKVRQIGSGAKNHLLVYKYQDHYDAIVVKSELNTSPTTNQMMVVCPSPPDLTENCSGISLLFHEPTTASECLNSSGGPENIHGQRFSTQPVASVNITSDIVPHDSSDSFTGAQTDTDSEPVEDYLYHLKKYRSTNPRNCIIGHLNINSIRYKFEAVQSLLHGGLLDIFAISESKLDESFPFAQFKVTDFSLHRKDRDKHGGGILLYMRSDIPHRRRYDLEPETPHGIEIMIIETRLYRAEKWFLVSVYKPPKIKERVFEIIFTDICKSLQRESPHWFVMGDINLDINFANSLCDVSMVFNLTNLVNGPTCFKGDTPSSVDVLLSSEPKRFKCALNTRCSLSDFHNFTCVATKLHTPHTSPKTIHYRSYKKFNDDTFINDVQNIPFSVCDVFDDVDDRVWSFNRLFSDIIDKNAPTKKKTLKKPSLPYMNSRLRRAIHKKNMLYNAYKKGKVKWDTYRKQRNLTTAINKQSKSAYFRERCDGGPKKQSFWKAIKPFISDKGNFSSSKNHSSGRGHYYQ